MDEDEFDSPSSNPNTVQNTVLEGEMHEQKLRLKEDAYRRENRRLRNSFSFRTGVIITQSLRKPWKLIVLPFSLMNLAWGIGNERLGRRSLPYPDTDTELTTQPQSDCVVLFPTNGVGFGHFTRMYALAKRIRSESPSTEVIFFTTMPTLQILYNDGFPSYHLAGRKKHQDMSSVEWNVLVEEHLSLVFNQHRPSLFVYDGAYPYRGMLNAIRARNSIKKVWLRRGMFKKGANIPVDSIEHFSLIVRPGDSIDAVEDDEVTHAIETISVNPMLLMDKTEILTREEALARLNLGSEKRVVYIQLGAGRINNIDSEIRMTVNALLEYKDLQIIVGESMLGERIHFSNQRVRMLRDYPNSIYFNAFDASIQAGGYNSFHEMRSFEIPTLFYPNMNTGMDDQLARCERAEEEGWGLVLESRTATTIKHSIKELLSLKPQPIKLNQPNGAEELASTLVKYLRGVL